MYVCMYVCIYIYTCTYLHISISPMQTSYLFLGSLLAFPPARRPQDTSPLNYITQRFKNGYDEDTGHGVSYESVGDDRGMHS